jgi:hypothetical protein
LGFELFALFATADTSIAQRKLTARLVIAVGNDHPFDHVEVI